jgi:predicted nucleic acid-binding protein
MMTEAAFRCVIDASVALKLFFDKPRSEKIEALFTRLDSDPQTRFYVPDLFYAECANVLATVSRLKGYTPKQARDDMEELRGLGLHVVPTADLAQPALDIAIKHHVSGYDACYVALAERVKSPMITADEKLVRAMAGKEYAVYSLISFTLPPAAGVE